MLPTIALRPSALTPPSASGASSQGGRLTEGEAVRQPIPNHSEQCKRCEARQTLWDRLVLYRSLLRTCWQAVCVAPSWLESATPRCRQTTTNRPFLTSDEAVAMFMCTLQNNWPRLGAQLALPGQLHLTALHTYFTLFSVQFQCLCASFSSVLLQCW